MNDREMNDMDEDDDYLVIAPLEMFHDTRLTLPQMRALGVLFSFREVNTNVVWPGAEAFGARCGQSSAWAAAMAEKLADLGWLKDAEEGAAVRYRIATPPVPPVRGARR